ncbi:hypothetical protein P167DRAFT_543243 [Morchella conica CCBAS932]|uniref:Uncharacterized protein n=1 Tax=Morchella conica CCBAS932 TaxID=1392247 RepID=A0A3N4L0Q9_9PEZI|nr:hypothetical protein P167DRAFT_543243 [Morchella conica CCBAS932]
MSSSSAAAAPAPNTSLGAEYTSPPTPIWNIGKPNPDNTPYPITTPSLKLFYTDIVDLSNTLQLLAAAQTAPLSTGERDTPEYHYLEKRRILLNAKITKFPPSSELVVIEKGQLEGYMQAIDTFQANTLPRNLVALPHTTVLGFLEAEIRSLSLAQGVLKGDYRIMHQKGTDRLSGIAFDFLYLKTRIENIHDALKALKKRALANADLVALEGCARVRTSFEIDVEAFKTHIDHWMSMGILKRTFTGKPSLK